MARTQVDLERQIKQTLIQKKCQAQKCIDDVLKNQVKAPTQNDDTLKLKAELVSTQKDLADEICMAKKREERLHLAQEQCNIYREELETLKQRHGDNDKKSLEKLVKNLEHQRSELFCIVKKQMKLIEVLRQQRAHVEAATLLNISEKEDLRKELNKTSVEKALVVVN